MQQTTFENSVAIGEIAHYLAISSFDTMLSTLFNNYTFLYDDLSYLCPVFKVVCCSVAVCWKGYITRMSLQEYKWESVNPFPHIDAF